MGIMTRIARSAVFADVPVVDLGQGDRINLGIAAILSRLDKDWLLQIERKTMDVLLDNIPWSYTKIFLPWNPYLITVEW